MKSLIEKDNEDICTSKDELSRELIIFLDLVPGIIHEINNSLTSCMVSSELLQEEIINLRIQTKENSINLNLLDHIEKLSLLNKTSTPKIQNIIRALLKEEILSLKTHCTKMSIDDSKFDHIDKLISLNLNSAKRIDLIVKAFRRLVSYDEDLTLIDVNEVVNTSILVLQTQLQNKYAIREDFADLPLVNFNFHQLNYVIISILLKTIELMDSGELHIKTYEKDNNIHINIQLNGGQISKESLDTIIHNDNPKSKIDLCSINKLLQFKGGTLDIKKTGEEIEKDFKNEMIGGIAFDIKINKDNIYISNLEKECSPCNEHQEDVPPTEINLQDFDLDIPKKNIDENAKSKNILIVDDDPQTLVSLFLSLKSNDLKPKVVIAKTAEAALEKFQEQDFALVISDYRLPGMDGINFLSYVKEKYPKTARVLITAFPNSVLKEEAKTKASVDLFVEKPWVTDGIKKLLQEIVQTNI